MSATPSRDYHFAFFGTPDAAVTVLNELEKAGLTPSLIVTNPDRPQGRTMVMTPPPTKVWAEERDIAVYQPESLRKSTTTASTSADGANATNTSSALDVLSELHNEQPWDFFVVTAYGKIIPEAIFSLPKHGSLNVHPSLLPRWRGPAPVQATIMADERQTGVTIIALDAEMDHGPIIAQERVEYGVAGTATTAATSSWPLKASDMERDLFVKGGALLARIIPAWCEGTIKPTPQDHSTATFSKKIAKTDGEISLDDLVGERAYTTYLKINAYEGWPGTYYFDPATKKRVLIKGARFEGNSSAATSNAGTPSGRVIITRITPEGEKERDA